MHKYILWKQNAGLSLMLMQVAHRVATVSVCVCLFVCNIVNDALSSSGYTVLNDTCMMIFSWKGCKGSSHARVSVIIIAICGRRIIRF
jgi:hypothetical protein